MGVPFRSVNTPDAARYHACGYTDLRLGIDGLAAVVTQQYRGHLDEEILFLFCGRRTDRIKALYWSGDGYILLYKRLSSGRFQWPRSEAELRLLGPCQTEMAGGHAGRSHRENQQGSSGLPLLHEAGQMSSPRGAGKTHVLAPGSATPGTYTEINERQSPAYGDMLPIE